MSQFFGALADLTALFHGLVVIPVIVFGPFVLFLVKKRVIWLERVFLLFGSLVALSFLIIGSCFLTTWEHQLRLMAGELSYQGGFISHYLSKIGVTLPDRATNVIFIILITVGAIRLIQLWLKQNGEKPTTQQNSPPY